MEVVINATSRRTNTEDELAFSEQRREPTHYTYYLRTASLMQISRVEFTPIARSLPLVQTLRVKPRRFVYVNLVDFFLSHAWKKPRNALENRVSFLVSRYNCYIWFLTWIMAHTTKRPRGVFSGLTYWLLARAKLHAHNVNINRYIFSALWLVWHRCIPSCVAMSSCYRIATRPIEPKDCAMHAPHSREWHAKN